MNECPQQLEGVSGTRKYSSHLTELWHSLSDKSLKEIKMYNGT